jgi:hypothetical protein
MSGLEKPDWWQTLTCGCIVEGAEGAVCRGEKEGAACYQSCG